MPLIKFGEVLLIMQGQEQKPDKTVRQMVEIMTIPAQETNDDEISLVEIWRVLKSQIRLIGVITAAATLVALLIAILSTPMYRATTLLAPVENRDQGTSALGKLTGSLGGFAGLGPGSDQATVEALAILKSRAFAEQFLIDEDMLPVLFEKHWDEKSQDWYPRRSSFVGDVLGSLRSALASISGDRGYTDAASRKPGPSMEEAVKKFNEIREVSQDQKTQLVELSIEWKDPMKAAQWTRYMVERLNQKTRQTAILEARKSIRYLEKEALGTGNVDIQAAAYSLIKNEMRRSMMANVNDEFSFRVIDPAVVPERRNSPKRVLIVLLGIFAGLSLAIFVALVRGAATTETS